MKGQFFEEKGDLKYFITSYSISFLSILHQNKALHTFHKRGQHRIARHIKGLDTVQPENTFSCILKVTGHVENRKRCGVKLVYVVKHLPYKTFLL